MDFLLPGTFVAAGAAILVYRRMCAAPDKCPDPQAYILTNKVAHARLLPSESAHRFTYQTLSLLVSLNALEKHELDLGHGLLFKYGSVFMTVSGLRSSAYLGRDSKATIKEKLGAVLSARGFDPSNMSDAWMQTMPSYFGFEGINPLTVYYCYTTSNELWLIVLEIHNTFGEQHIHVLEPGTREDKTCASGFDHQWTFRRQFHVSPFNDRSGFYRVSVTLPSHLTSSPTHPVSSPCPAIRVHLHTESPHSPNDIGPLKLIASLNPIHSTVFTATNWARALMQHPFSLFLSLPRILYQAWILHYRKWLAVYARPDPQSTSISTSNDNAVNNTNEQMESNGQGVGWLPETMIERFARRRVERLLQSHANGTGMTITLVSEDPQFPKMEFAPVTRGRQRNKLEARLDIRYQSSRFFTSWLISPSIEHLLLLKDDIEGQFQVSSRVLFESIGSTVAQDNPRTTISFAQRLRKINIPSGLRLPIPVNGVVDIQPMLDVPLTLALLLSLALERLEKWIFSSLGARFVPGQEPWMRWERALARHTLQQSPPNQVPSEQDRLGVLPIGADGSELSRHEQCDSKYTLGSFRDVI